MYTKLLRVGLFMGLFLVLAACGGSTRLPVQMDSFVRNAELKSSSYDAQDWQLSMRRYEVLVKAYSSSKERYSESEKRLAANAMGRYHALLIKNGVEVSAAYVRELKEIVPSYLEGLVDGLDEYSEDIKRSLEGLLDVEELEQRMRILEDRLDDLFGDLEYD